MSSWTKDYENGQALTEAEIDTALSSFQPDIAKLALASTGSSQYDVLTSGGSLVTPTFTSFNSLVNSITVSSTAANKIAAAVTSSTAGNAVVSASQVGSSTVGSITASGSVGYFNSAVLTVAASGVYMITWNTHHKMARVAPASSARIVALLGIICYVNGSTVNIPASGIPPVVGIETTSANWDSSNQIRTAYSYTIVQSLTANSTIGIDITPQASGDSGQASTVSTFEGRGDIRATFLRPA